MKVTDPDSENIIVCTNAIARREIAARLIPRHAEPDMPARRGLRKEVRLGRDYELSMVYLYI